MSFLVLVITDFVQKALVNRLRHKHPSRSKYGLVHYGKGGGKAIVAHSTADSEKGLELPDDMPIVEAYFHYVEQGIYSHPKARKMLSLDGDPVRFVCTPLCFVRHLPNARVFIPCAGL